MNVSMNVCLFDYGFLLFITHRVFIVAVLGCFHSWELADKLRRLDFC